MEFYLGVCYRFLRTAAHGSENKIEPDFSRPVQESANNSITRLVTGGCLQKNDDISYTVVLFDIVADSFALFVK